MLVTSVSEFATSLDVVVSFYFAFVLAIWSGFIAGGVMKQLGLCSFAVFAGCDGFHSAEGIFHQIRDFSLDADAFQFNRNCCLICSYFRWLRSAVLQLLYLWM